MSRFITVAIHTYERALALRALLENEGITVELNNVNLEVPGFSSGVRVRIPETDLPLALRIIENKELFIHPGSNAKVHTILVPVDLSENSFKAACVAANIATTINARIEFLYSYIDPYIAGKVQFTDSLSYDIGEAGDRQLIAVNARKLLENFSDRVRSAMKTGQIPAIAIGQNVAEGVPEDAIIEYAKDNAPALIVMGTRGADKKDKDLIGSVTAEVLDEGRFTVLTVPEPLSVDQSLKPRNILFMGNLDQDDILAIDMLYRLFGTTDASVTIVHLPGRRRFSTTAADKALRRLSDYCRANFNHYHFETVPVRPDDGEKEFERLQEKYNFDLIALPNRHRNAFSRLLKPGLAHKILFRTDIPMLVIPV